MKMYKYKKSFYLKSKKTLIILTSGAGFLLKNIWFKSFLELQKDTLNTLPWQEKKNKEILYVNKENN